MSLGARERYGRTRRERLSGVASRRVGSAERGYDNNTLQCLSVSQTDRGSARADTGGVTVSSSSSLTALVGFRPSLAFSSSIVAGTHRLARARRQPLGAQAPRASTTRGWLSSKRRDTRLWLHAHTQAASALSMKIMLWLNWIEPVRRLSTRHARLKNGTQRVTSRLRLSALTGSTSTGFCL